MVSFLLEFNTCAFAGVGVNANNWIGINMLVVLLFFTIAALIYALSNLLPPSPREKLKTTSKFEIMQMILSIFIIIILVGIASVSCNFTKSIVGMDPFEAAQIYIGKLLFVDGINLATHIYSTSIEFMIGSEIYNILGPPISIKLINSSTVKASASVSPSLGNIYNTYAGIIVSYNTLVIPTFGMLFFNFLMLFIVKATMLTVVLPVAIAMRTLSFLGPRLRESANSFLALAIAFYFIYPLTFVMDSYIVNWTYCIGAQSTCNPYYSSYPLTYTASSIPASSLFATNPNYNLFGFAFTLPFNFYSSVLSGIPFQYLFILLAPSSVGVIAQQVSDFLFQGIFLMALNISITVAFAISLTKALNAGFGLRSESIWS